MRRSSSGVDWMAREPLCPRKAERSNTSRPTPSSSSPQSAPVRPGTGSWVPVYTASKVPKGVFPLGKRRMVTSLPCHSRVISPSMGAPYQGWYRFLSARYPFLSRSRVSMP